jgi:hypothetical protein
MDRKPETAYTRISCPLTLSAHLKRHSLILSMQSQNQRGHVRHGIAGEITYCVLLILSIKL